MLNRVWLTAVLVGGVAMSTGACASTMQTSLNCAVPSANNADSLRAVAADQTKHTYANPGHRRPGGARGGIGLGNAPHRAVLVFEDNLGATQLGPNGEVAPETRSTHRKYGELANGQIIAQVWVGSAFQADLADPSSLTLPSGTSYIAACVPSSNGREPDDGTDIAALVIPANTSDPLTSITGKYYRTRQPQGGKRAWAFWSSASRSSVCIACGHGWCQF